MSSFSVFIPLLPPGINETYQCSGKGGKIVFYKTKKAADWQNDAALLIGAKAGEIDWEDSYPFYRIIIDINNEYQDVDAAVKLIIDTVSQKLNFDDKRILDVHIRKVKSEQKGVMITLKPTFDL